MSKKKKKEKKEKKSKAQSNGNGSVIVEAQQSDGSTDGEQQPQKLKSKVYLEQLSRHHVELVKLQEWVKNKGLKVVVVFEGRDAAGKGGVIKRITQPLNPRVCRVVALGTATDREKSQWFFQRYVA